VVTIGCVFVLGIVGGIIAAVYDPNPGKGAEYGGILGSLGAIPGFFLTLKWVLNRRLGSFTLHVRFHRAMRKK
jgi:hypothetical protein